MPPVRVKGIKRYQVRGRWFSYHRKSGVRLRAEFGTGAFFAELAALEQRFTNSETVPGTLGMLFSEYKSSRRYLDLAPATQVGYGRMINLLGPIKDMPVVDLKPQFIARLRDRLAETHGRRQANYVLAVVSVACEFGKERGIVSDNPVKGIRRVPRLRGASNGNRPWTASECRIVLAEVSLQLKLPIALAMFTGLRKSDVLALEKTAIRDGRIWRKTSKTGQEVSLPVHPDLAQILKDAPTHAATTVAATSHGTPWTVSGFNSSFIKALAALRQDERIGSGLTFHGLRHTVGTLLVEAGVDLDIVRRWLGQKTLAMAIHYSHTADVTSQMTKAISGFDPLKSRLEKPSEQ